MFRNKLVHKKKGFTLIELMIVISILLILIGFMIPKFSAYMDKAKNIKAVNTAKQIQTAAMASYGDNNGKFVINDVTSTITTLTTVVSDDIVSTTIDGDQVLKINYNVDGKNYTIDIDAAANTYELTPEAE
ncbi:type II secretion system protein [Clostridium magnum]|uniref:Fimbrial protein n=1 Tax=Clostridium magnum DSM 2767 TaxID=1121326 RepID=A0A162UR23_9CLOT|nr:prepilin-type N-terminal cleavage/methylation domain-containing protein [Clostridium magnum]KZL94201.1 fimbrial protein precursor [Clostridium magnum DSM 2767]SHH92959.1 type IV pilus assembly protein PilA [Clostridium magnum DSM 2767]